MTTSMTCPKCQGAMRTYERNGVHVDQCPECRGIFLDRGELERLVDAESSYYGATPAAAAPQPPQASPPPGSPGSLGAIVGEVMQQARASKSGSYGHSSHGYPYRGKKKKSFLGELFD
jgi:Zn-finger nucleic acid-binding protein